MKSIEQVKKNVAKSYGMTWQEIVAERLIFDETVDTVARICIMEAVKEACSIIRNYDPHTCGSLEGRVHKIIEGLK